MIPTLTATVWLATSPAAAATWAPPRHLAADYSAALVALGTGDLDRAEAAFSALVDAEPTCGMCIQGLGVSALRRGETRRARELLEDAATRWPTQPEVWISLSAAAFADQDFVRAQSAAAEAVQEDPGSLDGQAALQQVLLRVGALDQAGAALEAARTRLPDPVVACFEVQLAQETKQTPDPVRLDTCRQAGTPDLVAGVLSRAGDALHLGALAARLGLDPVVLVAQALDQHADGDTAAALSLLDEVLEGWPHRADARALRAQLRSAEGDTAGAQQDLQALLGARTWVDVHRSGAMSGILRKSDADRLASTIAEAAALQVDLLLEAGDVPAATDSWNQATELPPHPAPLAAGARLAVAQGHLETAWARVGAALEAFPDDPRPTTVAGAVALADPEGLPPFAEAALLRSLDWRDGHNLALVYRRRGQPADCFARTRTADAASGLPGEARKRLRILGYTCAVEARDWPAAAGAFRRLSDPSLASPVVRYNHALALFQGKNPQGAQVVLGALAHQDSELEPTARTAVQALALRLAVQARAWDEALALIGQGGITPEDQLWCAEQMVQDRRTLDARSILPDCNSLPPALAERCAALH